MDFSKRFFWIICATVLMFFFNNCKQTSLDVVDAGQPSSKKSNEKTETFSPPTPEASNANLPPQVDPIETEEPLKPVANHLKDTSWMSGCQPDPGGYFIAFEDNYTADSYVWRTLYFFDSDCTQPALTTAMIGEYFLVGYLKSSVGYALDYNLIQNTRVYHHQAAVDHANSNSHCSRTDWTVGITREVSGDVCAPETGDYFGSIIILGDQIYYSEDDGQLEPERSIANTSSLPLTKQ